MVIEGNQMSKPPGKVSRRIQTLCFAFVAVAITYWKLDCFVSSKSISSVFSKSTTDLVGVNHHETKEWPRIWPVELQKVERSPLPSPNSRNKNGFNKNDQFGKNATDIPGKIKKEKKTAGKIKKEKKTGCAFIADWHYASHPNCNKIHEINFIQDNLKYLASGGMRLAWKLHLNQGSSGHATPQKIQNITSNIIPSLNGQADDTVVFKNLRYESRIVYEESTMEEIRRDAMISDRLSSSPYIIDIYGYCGETVINEFANGGTITNHLSKKKYGTVVTAAQRHAFARDFALGMADIHEMTREGNLTTVIHHNLKPSNVLIADGKLKIHDFDDASILKWSARKNHRCGFIFNYACTPKYIQPAEECVTRNGHHCSEKTEVLKLGLIFYFLLNNHLPGSKGYPILTYPGLELPKHIQKSKNSSIVAMRQALVLALTYEEDARPSATNIAQFLVASYETLYG